MGKITTHVLDVAAGLPAAGMLVELHALDSVPPKSLARLRTNDDGRCGGPLLEGAALLRGRYSLTFHVAEYFKSHDVPLPDPPFLDEVVVSFGIPDSAQSYHIPLLVSPWSYSTYRGS
jgi:5-hydroxyisourate hydrolase